MYDTKIQIRKIGNKKIGKKFRLPKQEKINGTKIQIRKIGKINGKNYKIKRLRNKKHDKKVQQVGNINIIKNSNWKTKTGNKKQK